MEVSTKSACRQKLSAQILPYRTLMKPGKRLGGLQQHPLSFPTFPTEFLTGLRSTGYRADSGLWKRVLCLHSDLRTLEEKDLNQEGHNTRTASFHQLQAHGIAAVQLHAFPSQQGILEACTLFISADKFKQQNCSARLDFSYLLPLPGGQCHLLNLHLPMGEIQACFQSHVFPSLHQSSSVLPQSKHI